MTARAESLRERLTGPVRPALLLLLAGAGLVLLVAAVNLAGLQTAQVLARAHELAVRRTLGAGQGRILRQLVTENAVVALAGAAGGLAAAALSMAALSRLAPAVAWYDISPTPTGAVVLYTFAISLLSGVVIAFSSSRQAARIGHGPSTARAATADRRSRRSSVLLLAGQIAVSVILLVSATLLGTSLVRVLRVDPASRRSAH